MHDLGFEAAGSLGGRLRPPVLLPLTADPKADLLRRPLSLPLASVSLLLLAGCAPAAADVPPEASASSVTVDNCGTQVAFEAAPERVLTIKSTSTELLLALGLGDRIVGTAFQDGPLPDDLAEDAPDLPVVSEQVPSQEAVLELEPDLVFAGWESNFSAEGAGDRASLEALGVRTYVSPAACRTEGYEPEKLTFEALMGDIEELAAIFRVDATTLVEEQRAIVAGVDPVGDGRTALWYSSGSDVPYVGAGAGAPQLVLETLGLENIAGDVDDAWTSLGWEAIVEADPDVIVLVDAAWNTVEQKIERLESNPATANLTAVRNQRYLVIPFAASEAGVRTAPATADLAEQLAALELG